ncbi:GFA family protein [Aestuariivirga litoralis]|uniref:GFA family protein n=1 Tax=Aestuariivirga litoralis TaxID=2650924 RepID=UPI0018C734F8|nr:GFA family protein [Aestuariivirga litoralis]MBG1233455.1 GFA family protein [Aestuariivirga litoralis]
MAVQHYQGGCQCGAVHYQVDVDIDKTVTCNCSRCQRLGSVLAFTPIENFKLERGAENLTEYLFNTNSIHHLFCKTCGIQSYARAVTKAGVEMAAVNVNCLEGVEPRQLKSHHVDGRAM